MLTTTQLVLAGLTATAAYALLRALQPFLALYRHLLAARAIPHLPTKVLPVPQGLFAFFAFQLLRKLRLVRPGSALEKVFNVGRPDGFGMHDQLGDTFLTVSALGLGLVTADPKVASYVHAHRAEFPKPPNTGGALPLSPFFLCV